MAYKVAGVRTMSLRTLCQAIARASMLATGIETRYLLARGEIKPWLEVCP